MKTKKEIVEETAAAYNLNNRASVLRNGFTSCYYLTPDGERSCAVGRCMLDEKKQELKGVLGGLDTIRFDDSYLKEEYRGHEKTFWKRLQFLHDDEGYWDEKGLNTLGKGKIAELIEAFGQ